eukprot:CAMPEP_0197659438 /NCGR_PEP_ID=MMETSP1338-20131121/47636_1 /TAXON_ID=43686 ORGANISM="Pelagodinium beii, Strain RCC1491" /NCGR_SAMPLE_ID=MMETSP1338 /ASSEMBLY_ACC=CAM_ASM_000754 /LENGTH=127 /DNA_ID=CAMNT_0043236361 /DNA_START=64 /DNA_END=447 /DNA_ORIENTATION=+
MARASFLIVALFLGCLSFASAQSLKGSVTPASEVEAATLTKVTDATPVASEDAVNLESAPPSDAPTTMEGIVSFALIFAVPAVGIWAMLYLKEKGWDGAFAMICTLILMAWVYTAWMALGSHQLVHH